MKRRNKKKNCFQIHRDGGSGVSLSFLKYQRVKAITEELVAQLELLYLKQLKLLFNKDSHTSCEAKGAGFTTHHTPSGSLPQPVLHSASFTVHPLLYYYCSCSCLFTIQFDSSYLVLVQFISVLAEDNHDNNPLTRRILPLPKISKKREYLVEILKASTFTWVLVLLLQIRTITHPQLELTKSINI